jgi:hypothetical protein
VHHNVERAREQFTWPRVVEPLARLASLPGGAIQPPGHVAALTYRYLGAGLETVVRRNGLRGGARDVYRVLRRPPVP